VDRHFDNLHLDFVFSVFHAFVCAGIGDLCAVLLRVLVVQGRFPTMVVVAVVVCVEPATTAIFSSPGERRERVEEL